MKWVSIKERIPEDDLMVCLVCNLDYNAWECHKALYYNHSKTFIFYNSDSHIRIPMSITHWMEIKMPEKCEVIDEMDINKRKNT